ncbi:type II secretion system protein GspC [Pseudoalteromonas sp. G4]|uniref:type II secretion system protein GspC n=1 Tax=Pseudoalteromonas sp. G4 TaxID=2992761 RepID=UPI00237E8605|nr:type II secretion system protein GspC [Pseudoalteromonas sp. G4]MDE3272439.1 type II secretion system protein GspC [Pseudoalteromonas sp. G4]
MQLNQAQIEQVIAKFPHRKASNIVLVLVVIYVAYLAAQLTWMLWPKPQQHIISVTSNTGTKSSFNYDSKGLVAQNIFGSAEQKAEEKNQEIISDAPETTLNIKLTGVVAIAGDEKAGHAIIESQNTQETYSVSELVKGTRAQIETIFADRVIIKVSGRFETLMLDGIDYSKTVKQPTKKQGKSFNQLRSANESPATAINATKNADLKQELKAKRRELLEEPGKLFDYIRISPKRVDGQIVGYNLSPGKDPKLFSQMGLKSGDLATSINGYQLTDMKQAMAAIGELRNASSATIVIERQGQTLDVLFSLE